MENKDREGRTPLIRAAGWASTSLPMLLLLEKGASVDSRVLWGDSALTYAIGRGGSGFAKVLLEHGARIESRDVELLVFGARRHDRDPIDYADYARPNPREYGPLIRLFLQHLNIEEHGAWIKLLADAEKL